MNEQRALSRFEQARSALISSGTNGSGSDPLSRRRGIEQEYGAAYQQLVKLGLKPQIRAKYRTAP